MTRPTRHLDSICAGLPAMVTVLRGVRIMGSASMLLTVLVGLVVKSSASKDVLATTKRSLFEGPNQSGDAVASCAAKAFAPAPFLNQHVPGKSLCGGRLHAAQNPRFAWVSAALILTSRCPCARHRPGVPCVQRLNFQIPGVPCVQRSAWAAG